MYAFSPRLSSTSMRGVPAKNLYSASIPRTRQSVSAPLTGPRFSTRLPHSPASRYIHRYQAQSNSAPASRDHTLYEFRRLLEAAKYGIPPPEWFKNIELQGETVSCFVDDLRNTITQKNNELERVESRLNETSNILEEAKELQDATEAQLKVRTNEVELLKAEIAAIGPHRDANATASMERYRELEDALANVEAELQSHSESFHAKELSTPADPAYLTQIVKEQDKVFDQLKATLSDAGEEKHQAENAARVARLKTEEIERVQAKLQQDQELLSKELSQLQILYAEKEMTWMDEMQMAQDDANKLKEETAGLEVTLATKDRKLKTLTTSFTELQSDHDVGQSRLADLKRECAELQSVNAALQEQLKSHLAQKPDQETLIKLKSQISLLTVRVPALEEEITEITNKYKTTRMNYTDVEKELVRQERKTAQLEQRATILQISIEEKSNRLVATQKEKRSLKSDADRLQRETTALQQQLSRNESEFKKLRYQLDRVQEERRQLHSKHQEEIVAFAQRHQEAQHVILYHQEHRNENHDLKTTIAKMQQEIEGRKAEAHRFAQSNAATAEKIQSELAAAETVLKEKERELSVVQEERDRMEVRLSNLRESQEAEEEERSVEVVELKKQLREAQSVAKRMENGVQGVQNEVSKLQNELGQRQRIISVRDQEIVTLKDDARLANERVETLRGQITSMQALNREMEAEMGETDDVVSKLNSKLQELQCELDERQRNVHGLNKTIADLELKGKHSMNQFSGQIESLEEYSKQQEALVESFFEEKQALEQSVKELNSTIDQETSKQRELQSKLQAMENESAGLKVQLRQAKDNVAAAKEEAAAEIDNATEILAKAEAMAKEANSRLKMPDPEMVQRVRELETQLDTERQTTSEALARSAVLESNVASLKQEMAKLGAASDDADMIAANKRLSESLAAEAAAMTEIQHLKRKIKTIETESATTPGVHASASDDRFNDLRRHASNLEAENEKLRRAAQKSNQILAQSRSFIEQYLSRSISTLPDLQK